MQHPPPEANALPNVSELLRTKINNAFKATFNKLLIMIMTSGSLTCLKHLRYELQIGIKAFKKVTSLMIDDMKVDFEFLEGTLYFENTTLEKTLQFFGEV